MSMSTIITFIVIFFICLIGVLVGWAVMTLLRKPYEEQLEEEAFVHRVRNRMGGTLPDEDEDDRTIFAKIGAVIERILPTSRARMIEYQVQLDAAGMKITAPVMYCS